MTHDVLIAGFGGQGILLMGHMLAEAALMENKQVSWLSSYGQEMRGGTANCSIIVSDERIGSPVVDAPSVLMPMNLPSLTKFEPSVQPGGVLIVNSSLVIEEPRRNDLKVFKVPMNDIAEEINPKSLNLVGLGALVANSKVVSKESALKAIDKMFSTKFANKPELLQMNLLAFERGYSYLANMDFAPLGECVASCASCQQSACAI